MGKMQMLFFLLNSYIANNSYFLTFLLKFFHSDVKKKKTTVVPRVAQPAIRLRGLSHFHVKPGCFGLHFFFS